MKKYTNYIIAILCTAVICLTISVVSQTPKTTKADAGGNIFQLNPQGITEASTTVGPSGTVTGVPVLGTSTSRLYASISNAGSYGVFLNFSNGYSYIPYGTTTPVTVNSTISNLANSGIYLAASTTYTLETGKNMYYGPIFAITSAGTTTITTVNASY